MISSLNRNLFLRLVVTAALLFSASSAALAQSGRLGATFGPGPFDGTTRRFSGVAYDAASDAFLVVWGLIPVGARFVSAEGDLLGSPVKVNTSPAERQAAAVRTACGGGVCLVAWLEEQPSAVMGRVLRNNGGSVQFLTDPFLIALSPALSSSAPGVAYSPSANEFLVAWAAFGSSLDVSAMRVSAGGVPQGMPIPIATTDLYEAFPSLTYNTLSNEYLVAYFFESGASSNVGSQRVQPGTGALIGGRSTIYGSVFEQYPEIAYNSQANQYLAITWGFSGASWMLHGGLADGTAEPLPGAPLSLAAGGGGDGIGLAYHPLKNSYLGVFLSTTNDEIWGVEVGSNGVPGAPFQVTVSGTRLATQPRPAADPTRQRWLAVASDAFTRVMGQFVGTGAAPTGVPVDGTPPPTSSPTPGACTTIQPAPDWVCVNGNWLPPSEPAPTPAPAPAPTPPPPGTCTTIQPAPDWVCVNGNWLPPGFGTPAPAPSPTPTPTPAPTPPPPGTCTTASPVPGWVCIGDNNWVPPDHPLANPTTPSPTPTPTPLPTGCTATIASPVPGWVCVGDAWVPPDHPLALALAGSGG